MIDQARAPSPFRWRVERQDVVQRRRGRAARAAAEADAVVGRVLADRARLAVEGGGKIGDRYAVAEREIERPRLVGAERPDIAVDEPEQVGSAEHGGLGSAELRRQCVVRHRAVVLAQERLLRLRPVRTHAPAVPIGVGAAQPEIFGPPAERAGGTAEPRAQRRQAGGRLVGVAQQCILVGCPGTAPAATVTELANDLPKAGEGSGGEALRCHHRDDLGVAIALGREVERPRHLGLPPIRRVAGVGNAEESGATGETAERSADQGGELQERDAASVARAQLGVLPSGPFRGVPLGQAETAGARVDRAARPAEV